MFRGISTLARLTPAALAAPAVALCDEKSARGALADLIDKSEARRGDGTSLGPTMVRLAWHSAGTFCAKTGTGGSDAGASPAGSLLGSPDSSVRSGNEYDPAMMGSMMVGNNVQGGAS